MKHTSIFLRRGEIASLVDGLTVDVGGDALPEL